MATNASLSVAIMRLRVCMSGTIVVEPYSWLRGVEPLWFSTDLRISSLNVDTEAFPDASGASDSSVRSRATSALGIIPCTNPSTSGPMVARAISPISPVVPPPYTSFQRMECSSWPSLRASSENLGSLPNDDPQ